MGKTQKAKGTVPNRVMNDLGEHTVGGFALFYFNSETGCPQHILSFDTPVHCLAMQKYMTDWCNALQAVYLEGTKINIKNSFSQDD